MNENIRCIVCKTGLDRLQQAFQRDQDLKTCNSSICRTVPTQRANMSDGLFDIYLRQQQQMLVLRSVATEKEDKRLDALRRKQSAERNLIGQRVFAAHPHLSAENTSSIEVPVCKEPLARLPVKRTDAYRRHLEQIVDEALATDIPDSEQKPVADDDVQRSANPVSAMQSQLDKTSETICALCRGACCTRGGDIAYLTGKTVLRVRGNNPDWDRDQLLRAYLDRLSPETVEESCVNHSSQGCSLNRELRSDICNDFYCDSLEEFRRHAQNVAEYSNIIAVQRGETNWRRYAPDSDQDIRQVVLVDDNGVQELSGGLDDLDSYAGNQRADV